MKLIVTRHDAAAEFIRKRLPEFTNAPVYKEATEDLVRGNEVAGNLPANLAALTARYIAIEYPVGKAPRGQEYTLEDMENAGAMLVEYKVQRIQDW